MHLSHSIFHEPWWLSAATGGNYEEVTVKQGGHVVGRFPFVAARRGPFAVSIMPAFTHLLGPVVEVGVGKPQSRLGRRLSIARALIDQLPSFSFFKQVLDPSVADGLGIADGLAFQGSGFRVSPQYTFVFDDLSDLTVTWNGMHTTARQHIRRAEERYRVNSMEDPDRFVHFYLKNMEKAQKSNQTNFSNFAALFSECQRQMSGQILAAIGSDGTPVAMTFVVWGHGVMYYLLSTRAPDIDHNGSVSLLLWSAIKHAHKLKLKLDLDGVYNGGSARFLGGFGAQIRVRLIVTRVRPIYRALQVIKTKFISDTSEYFA